MIIVSGLVLMLTAGAAATVPTHPTPQTGRRVVRPAPAVMYSAHQVESYLTAQQLAYIRPGYKIEVLTLLRSRPIADPWFGSKWWTTWGSLWTARGE